MGVEDITGKTFDMMFLEDYYADNVWPALVADYSAKVEAGAKSVELPIDETQYTVSQIPDAQITNPTRSQLEWGTPNVFDAGKMVLDLNRSFEINTLIGKLPELVTKTNPQGSAVKHTARVLLEQVNKDLRGEFDGAPNSSLVGAAISTSAANFGNNAHRDAILKSLRDAAKKADIASWPRSDRYVVVSPAYFDILDEALLDKNYSFSGEINDRAFTERLLPPYKGWNVVMDDSMDSDETASTANHFMYFGRRNEGIAYAQRLDETDVIPKSEKYKGALIRGMNLYGVEIVAPKKVLLQKTTIT